MKLGQFSITFFHAKEGTLFVEGVVLEPGKFIQPLRLVVPSAAKPGVHVTIHVMGCFVKDALVLGNGYTFDGLVKKLPVPSEKQRSVPEIEKRTL